MLQMTTLSPVGLIGVGLMGTMFAERLIAAGQERAP
jgi:3-hydroxyisobutyrate dehydrogenase-like beta-hydroxyacid dehydrogenase